MEAPCDFCSEKRAVVYCKSDAARLCLTCDCYIHSANSISRRHLRALVCGRCLFQPAVARLTDENLCLCQDCCKSDAPPPPSASAARQPLYFYSDCPSLADLSTIWPWLLDDSSRGEVGSEVMTVGESCANACWEDGCSMGPPPSMDGTFDGYGLDRGGSAMFDHPQLGSSSLMVVPDAASFIPCGGDQPALFLEDLSSLMLERPFIDCRFCDSEELFEGFSVGDPGFIFENNVEIPGFPQSHLRYTQDGGMDGLFMEKNFSVANSNRFMENAIERSSSGQYDCVTFQSSHVGPTSALQPVNNIRNQVLLDPNGSRSIGMSFPTEETHSNILQSFSNINGESSAANYQDCGVSQLLLTNESTWDSNLESSGPQARNEAKMRYNEKKKSRSFGKQIRYASRKVRADTRKRVKGRFVKGGEAYECDPHTERNR